MVEQINNIKTILGSNVYKWTSDDGDGNSAFDWADSDVTLYRNNSTGEVAYWLLDCERSGVAYSCLYYGFLNLKSGEICENKVFVTGHDSVYDDEGNIISDGKYFKQYINSKKVELTESEFTQKKKDFLSGYTDLHLKMSFSEFENAKELYGTDGSGLRRSLEKMYNSYTYDGFKPV